MFSSVSMQRELSLKFHRNNVYGHLEQVSRTCVYFHFQMTQLVLQTCSKCLYTLFLWKFNDSSLCIGNERYICTTICKHTMNSWLSWEYRTWHHLCLWITVASPISIGESWKRCGCPAIMPNEILFVEFFCNFGFIFTKAVITKTSFTQQHKCTNSIETLLTNPYCKKSYVWVICAYFAIKT